MVPTDGSLAGAAPPPPVRDGRGRWLPGASGNAAGKAPGTRNRATVLRERLGDDATEAALDRSVRTLVERVGEGQWSAAAMVLAALAPNPRGRPIDLGLPDDADDLTVMDEILRRAFSGDITLEEAQGHVRLLERRRALRAEAAGRQVAAAVEMIGDAAPAPGPAVAAPEPAPEIPGRAAAGRAPKPARRAAPAAPPRPREMAVSPASGLHFQVAAGAGPVPDALRAALDAARPPAPGPASRATLRAGTARIPLPALPGSTGGLGAAAGPVAA